MLSMGVDFGLTLQLGAMEKSCLTDQTLSRQDKGLLSLIKIIPQGILQAIIALQISRLKDIPILHLPLNILVRRLNVPRKLWITA